MNSFKIGSKKRNLTTKYLIMFALGMFSMVFFTNAFSIVTNINNAVQYIKEIILTSDGTTGGSLGIILDGYTSGGRIGSDLYCTKDFSKCIGIKQIVNTGDIVGFLTGGSVNALAKTNLTCSNGEMPQFNGSSRSCGTVTDKYIGSANFNATNGLLSLIGFGGLGDIDIKLTGSNILKINGSNAYYDGAGNIGIGVTNPTEKLQVGNSTYIGSNYTCQATNNGGSFLRLVGSNSAPVCAVGSYSSDLPNIQLYDNGAYRKIEGGTTVPGVKSINFLHSTTNLAYSNKMYIDANGTLAIGAIGSNSLSAYKLYVNGSGKFDGNGIFNGNVTTDSLNLRTSMTQELDTCDSSSDEGRIIYSDLQNGKKFYGCAYNGSTYARQQLSN